MYFALKMDMTCDLPCMVILVGSCVEPFDMTVFEFPLDGMISANFRNTR